MHAAATRHVSDQKELLSLIRSHVTGRRGGINLMAHPLMQALEQATLSAPQVLQYCDIRYNGAHKFEVLLDRAHDISTHSPHVKTALYRNVCDERGWDYETGQPHAQGSHAEWRTDFLTALNIAQDHQKKDEIYAFDEQDSLATLTGILLVAEFVIPLEKFRILHTLRAAFPDTFTSEAPDRINTAAQKKASHYLHDHIEHDLNRHLPELADAALADFHSPEEHAQMVAGIERFVKERIALYDSIQQQIGMPTT